MNLPQNVIDALRQGQKIKAIKLLRKQHGIGLKEAKDIVDQYLLDGKIGFPGTGNNIGTDSVKTRKKGLFLAFLVIAAFVWAMINLVEVAGSVIVIWHQDNYHEATFVIDKVYYKDDPEAGLTWGFVGKLLNGEDEIRMYAPKLADAKALGYQGLRRIYPTGMHMKVWYNPDVTPTLFQKRTLQIVPYTPNLEETELVVIYRWLLYCLLPLIGILFFARAKNKSDVS